MMIRYLIFMVAGCWNIALALPPANDQFISAELLSGSNVNTTGTTVAATSTVWVADYNYLGEEGTAGTVWYRWTAPAGVTSVRVKVNFNDAAGECIVRTGLDATILVAGMAQYSDAAKATGWTSFLFKAVPGTEYRIKVASPNGSSSGSSFSLSIAGNVGTPPVNDTLLSAIGIPSLPNTITTGTFQGATCDAKEGYFTDGSSMYFTNAPAAIWYRWVAPVTGNFGINIIGQKYLRGQVVLSSEPRTLITDSRRAPNGFKAVSGQEYYIKVISELGGDFYSGSFQLILAPRPYSDQFVYDDPPRPLDQSLNYQLSGATPSESGISSAPAYSSPVPNVYCYLTMYPAAVFLEPGLWEIGSYDPKVIRVTVFVANDGFPAVATNDFAATTRFVATSATAYYAEVSLAFPENASSGASLGGRLTLKQVSTNTAPTNDRFANAIVLNSQPLTTAKGTTFGASGEISEDFSERGDVVTRDIASRSVWYQWTPVASGNHYLIALDEENKPLHVRLVTGLIGALSNLGADEELRRDGVVVGVAATYHICVDDENGSSTGNFRLFIGRNLNFDRFTDRQSIFRNSAGIARWRYGSSLGMTRELEPDLSNLGHTAWFEYYADSSMPLYINTFGSSYDTVLHVYTGTTLASLALVASNDDFDSGRNRCSALSFIPVSGTSYKIRVSGFGDQAGVFALQVGMQPASWKPYEIWALNYDWAVPERSELMDPDGDGLNNLQECVFGGNPLVREDRRSPATISGQNSLPPQLLTPPEFGIRYRVVSQNLLGQGLGTPITVIAQSSNNLSTWETRSSSVSSGVTTAVVPMPSEISSKVFLRTKVTTNP